MLEEAYADLQRYHGREYREPSSDNLDDLSFGDAVREFDRAVGVAIRAGLTSHPLVVNWLSSQRGLGQREVLRRTKRGLETGVRRSIPLQLRPTAEDQRIFELHKKGLSAEAIRRKLGLKISRQAVRKRLSKLGQGGRPLKV
jgi:hypothetical protein